MKKYLVGIKSIAILNWLLPLLYGDAFSQFLFNRMEADIGSTVDPNSISDYFGREAITLVVGVRIGIRLVSSNSCYMTRPVWLSDGRNIFDILRLFPIEWEMHHLFSESTEVDFLEIHTPNSTVVLRMVIEDLLKFFKNAQKSWPSRILLLRCVTGNSIPGMRWRRVLQPQT